MPDPALVVRVAANIDAFRKNFAENVSGTIETTKTALASMSTAYDGSRIITQANATVAAIDQIGGATKLTANEQAQANLILQAAIEKYTLLGKVAPEAMTTLAAATKKVSGEVTAASTAVTDHGTKVNNLHGIYSTFGGLLGTFDVHVREEVLALGELSSAVGKTAGELGTFTTVGLAAGALAGGWSLGRMVAEYFDLDKKISGSVASFMGWGNAAKEAAGATADALQLASQRSQRNITNISEAIQINTEWVKKNTEAAKANAEAQKQMADAMVELNSAGTGWKGTLNTINGDVVEAVKWYLEAGVSQDKLATAYDLTATQVRAVDSALKDQIATEQALQKAEADRDAIAMNQLNNRLKVLESVAHASLSSYSFGAQIAALDQLDQAEQALAKDVYASINSQKDRAKVVEESILRHIELMNQEMAVQDKQKDVVNAAVIAEFEAQRAIDAGSGAVTVQKTALERLNIALDELHRRKVEGISQSAQEAVLEAQFTEELNKEVDAINAASIARAQETDVVKANTAAKQAAAAIIPGGGGQPSPINPATGKPYTGAEAKSSGFVDQLGNVTQLGSQSGFGSTFGGVNLTSRDSGGPVSAGQPIYVGKGAQPELFVPQSAGNMFPAGSGGGITVHAPVTINGSVLSNKQEIANVVGDAIIGRLRPLMRLSK